MSYATLGRAGPCSDEKECEEKISRASSLKILLQKTAYKWSKPCRQINTIHDRKYQMPQKKHSKNITRMQKTTKSLLDKESKEGIREKNSISSKALNLGKLWLHSVGK